MDQLATLISKSTRQIRNDVMCSIVVFPKTSSLDPDNTVLWVTSCDGHVDYDNLIRDVETQPEMIAVGARDDLKLLFKVLKEVHETLALDQFDSINVYRGGVDLVRIKNTTRTVNRSAYIEINEYRRRLQHILHPAQNGDYFASFFFSVMTTLAVIGITYLATKKGNGK